MRFADASMLWLLALVPLLGAFFALTLWRDAVLLRRFADIPLARRLSAGASLPRRLFRMALVLAAVLFLALALARPQWGAREETIRRRGLDIVIAVDVSLSMLAEDVKPSRLARSRREIQRFVERLDGDRVALVAFAGDAFLQCPLTSDYAAFRIFLDVLDPSLVETPGTDIARALEESLKAFPEGPSKHHVIVLLTDGEDHGGRALKAAGEAARRGVVVHTVGIGGEAGAPIPVEGAAGRRVTKRDRGNNVVSTRLDPDLLAGIARATGGEFHHARTGRYELPAILERISAMEKREEETRRISLLEERFQLPLAVALGLLVLEMLVSERRRRRRDATARFA